MSVDAAPPSPWWLPMLVDPCDGRPLLVADDGPPALTTDGARRYPIRDGVARFVEDDDFVESFGFQWNEFEVRIRDEDEATFALKTGVPLASLAGRTVLDAGCGGGRYARVALDHGALVAAVDRSRAVDKARAVVGDGDKVFLAQADLKALPFREESFDLVFSIGVLHHGPDTREAFGRLVPLVRRGGRLSVWVYRKNAWWQEWLNDGLRRRAARMPRERLLGWCRWAASIGGVPVVNRLANKIVNFSNHARREIRECDNFDWYAPKYQWHHEPAEVAGWFANAGFRDIRELPPVKTGALYRWAWRHGWIIGSGVNMTGIRA